MANVTITDLPVLTIMNDADVIPVVNVGTNTTQQISGADLKTYFGSGSANTGNVTFDNVTVQGVNGLNLSAGTDFTADLAYLRVRAGDFPSHIHLDTGNSQAYDQYFGDDSKYVKLELGDAGNVVIGTYNGNTYSNWTFGSDGNLTLPNGAVIKDTAGNAVAIGQQAGQTTQGISSVAVGSNAGNDSQGSSAVAIGVRSAQLSQGIYAVAIGADTGETSQGASAVAVGTGAGNDTQGIYAVAIGASAGESNQGNNSIIINATGATLDQTTANTFTVAPVRNDVANIGEVVFYNTTSKEITYGNTVSVSGNISGGNANITATTASTSRTTGALRVAGGVGVAGAVNVGTSVTIDGGAYGNVVTTQFASVFASGSGPNPRSIMQVRGADGVAGIGIQGVSSGPGQIYANANIIFTTGATLRDKDFPTGGTTRATLDSTGLSVVGTVTTTGVITTPVALSTLTAVAGARAFVNDGNLAASSNFGVQIGSGGSNVVSVWSDGALWYIG